MMGAFDRERLPLVDFGIYPEIDKIPRKLIQPPSLMSRLNGLAETVSSSEFSREEVIEHMSIVLDSRFRFTPTRFESFVNIGLWLSDAYYVFGEDGAEFCVGAEITHKKGIALRFENGINHFGTNRPAVTFFETYVDSDGRSELQYEEVSIKGGSSSNIFETVGKSYSDEQGVRTNRTLESVRNLTLLQLHGKCLAYFETFFES